MVRRSSNGEKSDFNMERRQTASLNEFRQFFGLKVHDQILRSLIYSASYMIRQIW